MVQTRPLTGTDRHLASRTLAGPADDAFGAARYAAHLEALLGDPRDRTNPYGRAALWAAGHGALPAPPNRLPDDMQVRAAPWQIARALRPLLRRDLALARAWTTGPLLNAPVPPPTVPLLGPAALLASAAGVLRGATRIVDGLGGYEPGAGQWRPVLASAFADLLACESLTAVALRSCAQRTPSTDGPDSAQVGQWLADVVGYLVPQLLDELLGDLELVLNECGFGADTLERRTLARIQRDKTFAGADWASARDAQARVVRTLSAAGTPRPVQVPGAVGLFTITEGVRDVPPGGCSPRTLAATLEAADERLADDSRPGAAGLSRLVRTLLAEQRALQLACAADAVHDPADPEARALADRQALLALAVAVLGVWDAAAGTDPAFLGEADWALLALGRISRRLALPLPGQKPETSSGVWDELVRRAGGRVDCDLYATRTTW
ncbi:hypothetical protein [Streptomyces sp. NPDC054842]